MGVTLWCRNKWYSVVIVQKGRRERRALHTQERKVAERIRRELEASHVGGRWNVRLSTEMTWERSVELFETEYEDLHHATTTRKYTKKLFDRFGEFLKNTRSSGATLDAITYDDIVAYQRRRSEMVIKRKEMKDGELVKVEKKVRANTVNRDIRELSTLFNWAVGKGACRTNPCEGVKTLKDTKLKKRPLNNEEVMKLLTHLPVILADVARVILDTAIRLGEALSLRVDDIDWHEAANFSPPSGAPISSRRAHRR